MGGETKYDVASVGPLAWPLHQLRPRYQAIPAAWRLSGHITFVHEYQVVARKVVEPFVPRDRPELRGAGEVEPNPRAAIADVDRRRAGLAGLTCGRFRSALGCPFANQLAILGG